MTHLEAGAIVFELSKLDASLATYIMIHYNVGMTVINELGDEEQKQRVLTDTMNMNKYVSFALTEPDTGSNATSIETSATRVEGGWLINGQKRWIGSASFSEYICVCAKNTADGNRIQCYLVTRGSPGLSFSII